MTVATHCDDGFDLPRLPESRLALRRDSAASGGKSVDPKRTLVLSFWRYRAVCRVTASDWPNVLALNRSWRGLLPGAADAATQFYHHSQCDGRFAPCAARRERAAGDIAGDRGLVPLTVATAARNLGAR